MQDSLYVALSSQIALERRLDTIADNVANASTIGFRATGVKFQDVVSGTGPKSVSFASSGKTYLSGAHGALTETGNPFDFAVQGDAWFAIDTPAGTVMTRDGRFSMNENGELMSIEGYPVLDSGGAQRAIGRSFADYCTRHTGVRSRIDRKVARYHRWLWAGRNRALERGGRSQGDQPRDWRRLGAGYRV